LAGQAQYVRLDGGALTLVFALTQGSAADIAYFGARLPGAEDLSALARAQARGRHESQPDAPPVPGLLPQRKGGWSGMPAVIAGAGGKRVDTDFRLIEWQAQGRAVTLEFADSCHGFRVGLDWRIGSEDVVHCAASFTNGSAHEVTLERLASLALPLPPRFTAMTTFAGRWAGEMRESRRAISPDGFTRRSAIGKPGFGGGNWLLLHDPASGEVLGAHLAWSGDYETLVECDNQGAGDGRAMLQMGAAWDGGEIVLASGERFDTPAAIIVTGSSEGALTRRLHRAMRGGAMAAGLGKAPRKVHLNTWEALGFGLSMEGLKRLAADAAALGVERFVLDDGWFGGRRSDRTSLGDWFVSPDLFPDGLDPLIHHVHSLGMDFGLWVEPEMVSPDSELYRAHPDWCLHLEGGERATMRGQLVLDLTRQEVRDHLCGRLDALLRDHAIAYLKWDHNRDLFPLAGKGHRQTAELYRLLAELNEAHPEVEIESCSSGGGRIDLGILRQTHRVWPSDNNDPVERLRIMRSWSRFLPLEVLGNHVGPSPNPVTGRRTSMDFRAKVALFGHMGVEADPDAMSEAERGVLAEHMALYKEWRGLLHSGALYHLDHPDPAVFAQMVVGGAKALAVAAQTAFSPVFDNAPVRLQGLDPQAPYRVTLPLPWPEKAALYLPDKRHWRDGFMLSGAALMTQGLALPLTHPETAWLIALEQI
jgi:alpha-galactosidase